MATSEHPIRLVTWGDSLLTRDQGAMVRKRLVEAVGRLGGREKILVDFEGIEAITPSFADECLGRLLLNLGLKRFRATVRLRTTDATIRRLVNHVLAHRAKEASGSSTRG
ncbi:MAG: STAS-like domain-containing protein [Planctomycetaceae bacterium]